MKVGTRQKQLLLTIFSNTFSTRSLKYICLALGKKPSQTRSCEKAHYFLFFFRTSLSQLVLRVIICTYVLDMPNMILTSHNKINCICLSVLFILNKLGYVCLAAGGLRNLNVRGFIQCNLF